MDSIPRPSSLKNNNPQVDVIIVAHFGLFHHHCEFYLVITFYVYLLNNRKTEKDHLLIPQLPTVARMRTDVTSSLELSPNLLREWKVTGYLRHHLLPPRMCVSRKLDQKWRQDSNPGTPI